MYPLEDHLTEPVDNWPAQIFHPDRIQQSLAALEAAQPDAAPLLDAAYATRADCDAKLARYRAVLEAGADPALIAT
ncbi:hypothetical protein [Nocardia aurantia]|uniref:Uncharacterized protein n=1 Tax=Nocardia aurantia TaxID=2585199 RepID=A0A7K0E1U1_9NOCA|nr:hypothetical protein [Nocardia aurantia]MQY32060.1 hypothetical protein [Nocardia aurantia]